MTADDAAMVFLFCFHGTEVVMVITFRVTYKSTLLSFEWPMRRRASMFGSVQSSTMPSSVCAAQAKTKKQGKTSFGWDQNSDTGLFYCLLATILMLKIDVFYSKQL